MRRNLCWLLLLAFVGCKATYEGPSGVMLCEPHNPDWNVYRFHTDTMEILGNSARGFSMAFRDLDTGKTVTLAQDLPYTCSLE